MEVPTIATNTYQKSLSDIARQLVWKVSEAALVLRCNQATIRRELKRGAITGVRIGNEWRIPSSQFSVLAMTVNSAIHGASIKSQESVDMAPIKDSQDQSFSPESFAVARHTLKISLLGRPHIHIDGVQIGELERSNRRSQVIQLLALHRTGLSGSSLASSLDMSCHQYEDESLNPHYVRNLVWGTREKARKASGWGGIIESPTRRGVGLHHYRLPESTVCDLWEFEDKLDEADRLHTRAVALSASGEPQNGVIAQAAALREEALQLYKGEFCEGSNNGCISQAARILEGRYVRSALHQGDYWRVAALEWPEMQAADNFSRHIGGLSVRPHPEVRTIWREALRNYERVLKVDNYHEEAYIHAMECYAQLGNTSGVDEIFARCRDVLRVDLLQPPGDEVVRAYQECKSQPQASGE